jgi:hypothetical protein
LESVGNLYRPSITRDSKQGTVNSFGSPIAQNVPCSVQPASPRDQMIYGQRNVFVSATIYFVSDIGAQVNDVFQVVDQNGLTHTYLVKGFAQGINVRLSVPYTMACEEITQNRLPQPA